MNLENIIFESDAQAQVVAGAIHANHVGVSVFSILKKLLILNQNFEVNFVKCQVNSVTYKLYRMVNFLTSRYIFYFIRPYIMNQLINKMS
jgi:hypothetical protein